MQQKMPLAGSKAPDFELPDQEGRPVRLSGLKGRPVVLYFYPKDETPGCTAEACEFRDSQAELAAAGAVVLGVSPDSPQSHAKFAGRHSLNFTLLSDKGAKACSAWGAWGEKSFAGREYHGVLRTTFVIDAKGVVARVFGKVKPQGHAAQVLAAVRSLR